MIQVRRRFEMPETGALRVMNHLSSPNVRVWLFHTRRVINDDSLAPFAVRGPIARPRPFVALVLEGRGAISMRGKRVEGGPGVIVTADDVRDIKVRTEGERFTSIHVDWNPDVLGSRVLPGLSEGRFGDRDLQALRTLAERAARELSCDDTAALAVQVLDVARRIGVGFDRVDEEEIAEPIPSRFLAIEGAIQWGLRNIANAPALVDLQEHLGLGPRQIERVFNEYHAALGYSAFTWRDMLNLHRLNVGSNFMTAPGATTEGVSRALGYRNPTSFCRAMAQAGLPSPGRIRAVVGSAGSARG